MQRGGETSQELWGMHPFNSVVILTCFVDFAGFREYSTFIYIYIYSFIVCAPLSLYIIIITRIKSVSYTTISLDGMYVLLYYCCIPHRENNNKGRNYYYYLYATRN